MSDKPSIVGIECRHVVYCKPNYDISQDDCHFIKEQIHYSDGTVKPNIRLIKNYKRDYYIVKKGQQTFKDKKEYIKLDRVIKYTCTQSELANSVAKALGTPWIKGGMRKICRSPYIYGSDISSNALIKKSYQQQYPNLNTFNNIAVFDTETDMFGELGEIIMTTLSYKQKVFTVIKKSFLSGRSDVIDRLQVLLRKYLAKHVDDRKIVWEIKIVDTEAEVVVDCINKAHEWQPDILAIWNINFDMPKCIAALERANIKPEDVFSDPKVPKQFRHFNYVQGNAIKVTASGKETSKNLYELWHSVVCPSSFYFIDAMCLYYQIRSQSGKEQSYSLDAILNKHLGLRKLDFEEAEHLEGAEWHQFMQSKYPLEYVVYNVFDCVSMEILDEKILDMAITMPMFAGCSDYKIFNSQPKRLADTFHFHCLDNGYVYGTTSDEMVNELDSLTTSGDGWIITLPANLVAENGLRIIGEDPNLITNIRGHVGDLDVAGSYPNGGAVFNVSRETTHKELVDIVGVEKSVQRRQTINLSGGFNNAVEFCTDLYGLPDMETLLSAFINKDVVKVTI